MADLNWNASMPYDIVNIYDQTIINDASVIAPIDTVTKLGDPLAFIPFVSPKGYGEDNTLVYLNGASIARYGTPNLEKYGLSYHLVRQWINGGGNVLGMRLKPDDATLANLGIYAILTLETAKYFVPSFDSITGKTTYVPYWEELDSSEQGTGVYKSIADITCSSVGTISTGDYDAAKYKITGDMLYTLKNSSTTEFNTKASYKRISRDIIKSTIVKVNFSGTVAATADSLKDAFLTNTSYNGTTYTKLESDVLTHNTQYIVPIALFYMLPCGDGNYAISINKNSTQESYAADAGEPDRYYTLGAYDGNNVMENNMAFSFSPAEYLTDSMQLEDVVYNYANNIGVVNGNLDTLYALIENYLPNLDSTEDTRITAYDPTNPASIDILYGMDRNGMPHFYYQVSEDSVSFTSAQYLSGGSLGSFDVTNTEVRESSINNAMVNAYTGVYDDRVFDMVRFPFRFILQPTENVAVINAMIQLLNERDNTFARWYSGTDAKVYSTSRSDATNRMSNVSGMYTNQAAMYVNHGMIIDPYSRKKVDMPAIYFDAKALPRSIVSGGWGAPLAGDSADATYFWDDHIRGTLRPRSSKKEELILNHNARINTMIEEDNGRAYPYEQITTQLETSQLSEINNAMTLRKMIQYCYDLAKTRRWSNITDATEIANYAADLTSIISTNLNDAYYSLNITAVPEATNGAGASRIHCILQVSFNKRMKGVTYDIYII